MNWVFARNSPEERNGKICEIKNRDSLKKLPIGLVSTLFGRVSIHDGNAQARPGGNLAIF